MEHSVYILGTEEITTARMRYYHLTNLRLIEINNCAIHKRLLYRFDLLFKEMVGLKNKDWPS